ncbi:hypothetical protein [Kribbella sp. CA-293567]|uniref:hypothetical protein n=1 Tax=Kribbella sp. CA-293567 TaxID=3002436 RepID=UPI0022DE7D9D|nr:hypothetical protein [Kribbella sp. CA-293567]WBQ08737.1 hypothetical protein OX958_30955 [Kribbella sp. CA-293567]
MPGRFTVRPDDGDGTFGVWDGAVNGWRTTGQTLDVAERTKVDLDLQFNAHGPRLADDVRPVEPAQLIERAVAWESVELDTWLRDGGRWYGKIRDRDGHVTLVPQPDLRPAEDNA